MRPDPGAQAARLRSSRADRERVIDLLKAAFVQGRLTRDELDARVGQALASVTHAELAAVTADLPAELIGTLPPQARRRISMNTAVTGGAVVIAVANGGMMAALLLGSAVAVILVAVFTVIGAMLAIGAMIVARLEGLGGCPPGSVCLSRAAVHPAPTMAGTAMSVTAGWLALLSIAGLPAALAMAPGVSRRSAPRCVSRRSASN